MAPTPTPAPPLPDEPQVVVFNVPPELIGNLPAQNDTWFTQPVATVLAACIAVVAAVIAWSGARAQIKAEDNRVRRTEKIDALTEAYAAAHNLARQWGLVMGPGEPTAAAHEAYAEAFVRALLARGKLAILKGFGEVENTMAAFVEEVTAAANRPGSANGQEVSRLLEKLTTDITTTRVAVGRPQLRVVRKSRWTTASLPSC